MIAHISFSPNQKITEKAHLDAPSRKVQPGVNPNNLFLLTQAFFHFFTIRPDCVIVSALFFVCFKVKQLNSKNWKTKKNEVL